MKIFLSLATVVFLGVSTVPAADDKSEKLPHYDKQPSINAAIKQLTEAQKTIATDRAATMEHLDKATNSLEHAIKDKGSFRATAIRLSKQAAKHLENGDADTALHEITEALEAANKAGQMGAR